MSDERLDRGGESPPPHGLEEELQRERAIRVCLERCSPCGILFLDEKRVLRSCSLKFLEMMGRQEVEFIGLKSPFPFLSSYDQKKLDQLFTDVGKSKSDKEPECKLWLIPKYKNILVRATVEKVKEDNLCYGWLVFFTDLTDETIQRNRLGAMITQLNSSC